MEEIVLSMEPRTIVGKQVKALRREYNVPAVLYSRHGDPMILQANNRELLRVLARPEFQPEPESWLGRLYQRVLPQEQLMPSSAPLHRRST